MTRRPLSLRWLIVAVLALAIAAGPGMTCLFSLIQLVWSPS